jgi:hypothetical protein
VTFTLADGSRREARVTSNGVAITVSSPPQTVSFRDKYNVLHTAPM